MEYERGIWVTRGRWGESRRVTEKQRTERETEKLRSRERVKQRETEGQRNRETGRKATYNNISPSISYQRSKQPASSSLLPTASQQDDFFARIGLNGTRAISVAAIQNPLTRTGETSRSAIAAAHELFIDHTDASRY